ncbi:PAS domain S-box protein [Persicimonas caeni]|uniref:histidine kinase n=1 Tax=Persicimonas caeni TaxID=2292766 RepID=A0A4Y6PZ71_PERCE|nr:PAS domain S-box protein [Persicimonas caeni]QDG53045.1 PAS domain S-box protein [Persicimonas caeni]QED34267.1 PAS domain S-box protein [Persicimonas caeni]
MSTTSKSEQTSQLFESLAGEVGKLARQMDWSSTSLGPPTTWPRALRSAARLVLDSSLPMTLGWGPELIQIYNEGYLQILGDKHPDALGRPVAEVYSEIWADIGPILQSVYDTGKALWFEDLCLPIARQGFPEEMYFTFSYSPVRDDNGQIVGLLSSAVETTASVLARRRAEILRDLASTSSRSSMDEMLAVSLQALQGATDDIPCALLCRMNRRGRRLEVIDSIGLEHELAPSVDEIARWVPWERVGEDVGFLELPEEASEAITGLPATSGLGLIPICSGGGARDDCVAALIVGLSAYLPFNSDYRDFLDGVGRELARKVADVHYHQLRVEEAENRYRAVFEYSVDAMLLTAPDGRILSANPAACELLGYTESEICELSREGVVDTTDERLSELLAIREATGKFQGEVQLVHRSGRKIPCEVSSNIYRDARGNLRSSMVVRDIRRRLEMESNLRQAQKLDIVGKLAGGIAHDFNNLLTVIQSSAQLLEAALDPSSEEAEDVQIIQAASDRAAAMTRRLLAFSRSQPIRKTDLDLAEVIAHIDVVLRSLIGEHIEVVTSLEPNPWAVRADRQAIEQILLNLAVNARDAMRTGGRLTLTLANVDLQEPRHCVVGSLVRPGRYVSLKVSDTGGGIPADVGVKVFEPFYTTKKEGTGLGLATVADVTLECGGNIFMQSEPGEGTTFEVYLPVSQQSATSLSGAHADTSGCALPRLQALLVEDQPLVRKVTSRMLENSGLDVVAVAGGAEALEVAEERGAGAFDLVVCDVVMPQISGEEVARRLREICPSIEVLFISGHPADSYLRVDSDMDVNVLMKPFGGEELANAIRKIFEAQ